MLRNIQNAQHLYLRSSQIPIQRLLEAPEKTTTALFALYYKILLSIQSWIIVSRVNEADCPGIIRNRVFLYAATVCLGNIWCINQRILFTIKRGGANFF